MCFHRTSLPGRTLNLSPKRSVRIEGGKAISSSSAGAPKLAQFTYVHIIFTKRGGRVQNGLCIPIIYDSELILLLQSPSSNSVSQLGFSQVHMSPKRFVLPGRNTSKNISTD